MAVIDASPTRQLPTWNGMGETTRAIRLLAMREMRTALRTPAYLIPNMIVPIFFYAIMVGSLEDFANQGGVSNWKGFLLPMSLLFAVQGGSAGLNMVADIESGYFDKLLLTPASRLSILVGAMSADFFRIMVQAIIVLIIAVATGLHFETGVPGAIALVAIASLFGLAFSGLGFAIALRTGNAQATQSMWFMTMPLMFLTTMFAPKEALSGWLKAAATVNPMTYILDGMRALSMRGWDGGDIALSLVAIGLLGAFSLTMAFMALKSRLQ